ncbi:hypothetical protein AB6A40_007048 [Gnathostoma spinigerum]|uniref:Sugar transporter SWEET1 n=1 Tax=Gnathostoma spinigerum TaxID=75299 RepID=A0ABD6EK37_9BILA
MVFESITFMRCLSLTAFVTTVSLFFCGIPICYNIWRRRNAKGFSVVPFWFGVLSGCFWLRYGFLKMDMTMISVNVCAVTLMTIYLAFYFCFTESKCWITVSITILIFMISLMAFFVQIFGMKSMHPLGFSCMILNIINFGAPLAGIRVVLRQKSCETMPLPLCIANFLVSSQWMLYGILITDIYLIAPNGCGTFLSLIQLALFVFYPRKAEGKSISMRVYARCHRNKVIIKNAEQKPKLSWAFREHLSAVSILPDGAKDIKKKISGSLTTNRDSYILESKESLPTIGLRATGLSRHSTAETLGKLLDLDSEYFEDGTRKMTVQMINEEDGENVKVECKDEKNIEEEENTEYERSVSETHEDEQKELLDEEALKLSVL